MYYERNMKVRTDMKGKPYKWALLRMDNRTSECFDESKYRHAMKANNWSERKPVQVSTVMNGLPYMWVLRWKTNRKSKYHNIRKTAQVCIGIKVSIAMEKKSYGWVLERKTVYCCEMKTIKGNGSIRYYKSNSVEYVKTAMKGNLYNWALYERQTVQVSNDMRGKESL